MLFGETVAVYCENHTEHTDTLCGQNVVCTLEETHYVSTTKPNRLMLCGETVAVYCENHRNTQIHCVGRIQGFCLLKRVVHIKPLDSKGLSNSPPTHKHTYTHTYTRYILGIVHRHTLHFWNCVCFCHQMWGRKRFHSFYVHGSRLAVSNAPSWVETFHSVLLITETDPVSETCFLIRIPTRESIVLTEVSHCFTQGLQWMLEEYLEIGDDHFLQNSIKFPEWDYLFILFADKQGRI
jgi:hypothetical protein